MSRLISPAIRGTLIYESRIAARRKVLWIAMLPLLGLGVLICLTSQKLTGGHSVTGRMAGWVLGMAAFGTFGVGVALADRFDGLRRRSTSEVFDATPAPLTSRMAASLLGGLAIALSPAFLVTLIVGICYTPQNLAAIPIAVLIFTITLLPGSLLLATVSVALGTVVPAPVARAVSVVFWGWATLLSSRVVPIPSITGSIMSPLGDYATRSFFDGPALWAGQLGGSWWHPALGTGTAVLNLCCTFSLSALAFVLARFMVGTRR